MRIGGYDRQVPARRWKIDLIDAGAGFDGGVEKLLELGLVARQSVHHAHMRRLERLAGQLPEDANDRADNEFDLLDVTVAGHPGIMKPHANRFPPDDLYANAFVLKFHIALRPAQCVAKRVGGCGDVVQKPDRAHVVIEGEVKAEVLVAQRMRHQVDKFDLVGDADRDAWIVDDVRSQAGF